MARILVIEDEVDILENVIEALQFEAYEARGAYSGEEGILVAEEYKPDLILCDIFMPPGLNGYEVLMRLKGNANTAFIPFVFLTARTSRADQRQGMNLGADDYLTKPFTPRELLEMVRIRLEVKLQHEQEYERRLSELRSNLMYTLPHELRTPLTGILGYSAMIMDDIGSLDQAYMLDMVGAINRAGIRLYRLIENYLLYAQLEVLKNDGKPINPMNMHIDDIMPTIDEVVTTKATTYNRVGDIKVDASEVALRITSPDFAKIITEFLDNAFKFSNAGTPITITGRQIDDRYEICIADQGRGMTEEEIKQVGAYVQFNRRLYEQQGTGLGLIIGKRLTEMHGGEVKITSQMGIGTTISALFAMAPKPAPEEA
jgi:two-component system, sensor histidine kinase and response regulator